MNGSVAVSPEIKPGSANNGYSTTPNAEVMLEAMRRENEQLRNRLVDTERDYIRISRLNDIYREELIDHRRRVRNIIPSHNVSLLMSFLAREAWAIGRQLDRLGIFGSLFTTDASQIPV